MNAINSRCSRTLHDKNGMPDVSVQNSCRSRTLNECSRTKQNPDNSIPYASPAPFPISGPTAHQSPTIFQPGSSIPAPIPKVGNWSTKPYPRGAVSIPEKRAQVESATGVASKQATIPPSNTEKGTEKPYYQKLWTIGNANWRWYQDCKSVRPQTKKVTV
jgi:hypothetical protein